MSLSDSFEGLKNFDLDNLEFSNAGSWPGLVKLICFALLAALVTGAVYWFDIRPLDEELQTRKNQERELRTQFENKAGQVANLEEYKQQMVEMEKTFGSLLKQLPSDTEVPGLLEDISSVGALSGLELTSIDLRPEISKEFYIELPINIKLMGGYHDIAAFVSGVAGLSRIVTLHDFNIRPGPAGGEQLSMDIQAKTYRYSGDEAK